MIITILNELINLQIPLTNYQFRRKAYQKTEQWFADLALLYMWLRILTSKPLGVEVATGRNQHSRR